MRRGPLTREQRAVFAYAGITYESHRERTKKRRLLAEAAKMQEQTEARNLLDAYQYDNEEEEEVHSMSPVDQSPPEPTYRSSYRRRSSLAMAQKGSLDVAGGPPPMSYAHQSKAPPSSS